MATLFILRPWIAERPFLGTYPIECDIMKAIIPAAGAGSRMRPFTFAKPKPLINVAGKPIICHILDSLKGPVDEVIIVVGYMKEKLISFLTDRYENTFRFTFVEQEERIGLGHAAYLALCEAGDEPVLITLGDELFTMNYGEMVDLHRRPGTGFDATLGVKRVKNPTRYGVAVLDGSRIVEMEEKPEKPKTDVALAGVYIVENTAMLRECLRENLSQESEREYQLTDGLQSMLDKGASIDSFFIGEWYDCGMPDMLLNVNSLLLNKSGTTIESPVEKTIIVDPVIIGPGCEISGSSIGPHVTIDRNTCIDGCQLESTIVGAYSEIRNQLLKDSIIGDYVRLIGKRKQMRVGDRTEIVEKRW